MRIACIAAARPNFMKVKPVIDGLEAVGLDVDLIHTGQHYDTAMSDVFFTDLGIRPPDYHLGVGSGSHATQTAGVMTAFEDVVAERNYHAVVVVGDVNPTMACAIVGAKMGLIVAHVEAGLRSRDWSMPEEVNRVIADRVSDLLLAPSPDAVENLRAEGYREDQIHLVGNVMIDTLLANVERVRDNNVAGRFGIETGPDGSSRYGVVTLHRPSNVDDEDQLQRLLGTLGEVASDIPLIFSVHPRTRQRIEASSVAALPPGIHISEPLGYLDFLNLQARATLVLTDSGGIQEETTALGVPCLTLRENTERPITITEGTNTLVGVERDAIVSHSRRILQHGVEARCPALWDGKAGARIADVILARLENETALRPTTRSATAPNTAAP